MSRRLLLLNQWNKDKLIEKFRNTTNFIKKTFQVHTFARPSAEEKRTTFFCDCCYMKAYPYERIEMECNHPLCSECYKGYLVSAIKRGPDCLLATCPKEGCKLTLSVDLFRMYVPEPDFEKYQQYYLEFFINMRKPTKKSPSPKCNKTV